MATERKSGALALNMGKVSANGPFTPLVIALRSVVGEKKFNQIRGKGITLHSQVCTFCHACSSPPANSHSMLAQLVLCEHSREVHTGVRWDGSAAKWLLARARVAVLMG